MGLINGKRCSCLLGQNFKLIEKDHWGLAFEGLHPSLR